MSRRLDAELVRRGLARSRAEAVRAIVEGRVEVDDDRAARASQTVTEAVRLRVDRPERWVARSAHKLLTALDAFSIDPSGRLCLDVGASTGGFTQVLLARGARGVVALDVGHGQLVPELRHDPRVRPLEGVNARDLDPGLLARLTEDDEAPSLAAVDVSFIPLRLVLRPVASVVADGGVIIALVKPQFEVGRTGVRGGIVTDRDLRHRAVRGVLTAARETGLEILGLTDSPFPGSSGNVEYLCALGTVASPHPTQWDDRVDSLA